MDDFKVIARLLAAIRSSEESPVFDIALVDEKVLKTTAINRDILAYKLYKAGYVEGLFVIDDVPYIVWERSKPSVTLEGLTWMEENKPLRKAIEELKSIGVETASQVISSTIQRM